MSMKEFIMETLKTMALLVVGACIAFLCYLRLLGMPIEASYPSLIGCGIAELLLFVVGTTIEKKL